MEEQAEEIIRIREILKEHPKGLTIEDIAKKLPLNRTSTSKYLNTLLISGQAEMRSFGRAKVFTLSRRVPFSQMLNLSSDLLLVLDNDLLIRQVNEPFINLFGLSADTLIDTRVDQSSFIRALPEKYLALFRVALSGTEHTTIDRIEIGGREYFFRINLIPLVFDQGEQGLAVILEDITELKKYQQHLEQLVHERTHELIITNEKLVKEIEGHRRSRGALEESEKKYRELVENANSILLRVTDQGLILFFNEFAERFFGVTEAEMLGKNILGTIIPAGNLTDTGTPAERIREFLQPTEYLPFSEVECVRKNFENAWVAWTSRAIADKSGMFSQFLIVGMDITDRKNMENALHQVNAKLNMVSSITRHDILNKLTVIYSMNSFLQESITDPVLLGYLKKTDTAVRGIGHQIEFTHDYKDMGREKADWQNISDSVRKSVAHRHLKNLVIEVPTNGLEIFADPWLRKVFFNLIDNTVRHAEHATEIKVSYTESGNGLVLVYEDNGIGIPGDKKEKIFEQGFGKNNGYGLFMAREILAITGLTIRETGVPGTGARFEIQLPKQAYRFKERAGQGTKQKVFDGDAVIPAAADRSG